MRKNIKRCLSQLRRNAELSEESDNALQQARQQYHFAPGAMLPGQMEILLEAKASNRRGLVSSVYHIPNGI